MKPSRTITLEEIAAYLGVTYAVARGYYAEIWIKSDDFPLKECFPKKPYRFNRQKVMKFLKSQKNRKIVSGVNRSL